MKIRQTIRHFAAKQALQIPGLRTATNRAMVRLHTRVFLDRAAEGHRDERRAHLEALFDGSMDMYLAALQTGYTEAEAREITHIIANFDFYNHGWTEMMEFPGDELDSHYDRYADFFEAHGVAIDDPLGTFAPVGGLPDAPATPDRLAEPDYETATGGYEDDVYVEDESGDVDRGGRDEPDDVDPEQAPGAGGQ
ncbi:MAG: DUF6149 family protein [Halobacteriaceae archaeon]